MNPALQLYATPLSHFARKNRILMDLYQIPYEFIDVGNVAESDLKKFANNPLQRVPVLVDKPHWFIESDHISQYLVRRFDPQDRFEVFSSRFEDWNVRAVLNGIMAEEVKILIARRTSIPTDSSAFFDKALKSIQLGLNWLEEHVHFFDAFQPKYRDFHLVCAWDHLAYYGVVPMEHPQLQRTVHQISQNPIISATAPQSLRPKENAK